MACLRLMLRCLLVVTVAFGLASAPLYAVAQVSDPDIGVTAHHGRANVMVPGTQDHDHASPAKSHAKGQTCCHPGCIMAVVPGFTSLATAPVPWTTLAIPRDQGAVSLAPRALDRPPKRA